MLFGMYLKKYRLEAGLTQVQAATKLNLLGGDLTNIDPVTFSRWERGMTKPTIARSIRVLREFTNNLEQYLSDLSREQKSLNRTKDRIDQFDLILEQKYRSLNSLVNRASYNKLLTQPHNLICECPIYSQHDQKAVDDIYRFHSQTSSEHVMHGLQKIDLLDYCADNRILAYKYVNTASNDLIGHNIGAIFTHKSFESEIINLNTKSINEIDLRKTIPYTPNKKFVYYALSQHSLFERPFRLQLHREFKYLSQRANITDYYAAVVVKSSVDVLEKMGFSVVAYEEKTPTGAIKIGKNSYSRAIMHIETAQLFAQPEFLNLLTQCKDCQNPCSVSSSGCC
ncbi:helix-turn-helix domain-containing protein [Vibrio sp. TRT 29B02]|uniref:helix-turn-helix domain-containing protein n=1 Tax=Vibrio sp. TRT 29B02 TaxID=3418508 RepID=UPI003CE97886